MDEYTFVKWMDEMLDPEKVRREESFQSDNHRVMVADHEYRRDRELSVTASLEYKLADLATWWENRDQVKAEGKKTRERKRVERAAKNIVFTERELAIANSVFSKAN